MNNSGTSVTGLKGSRDFAGSDDRTKSFWDGYAKDKGVAATVKIRGVT